MVGVVLEWVPFASHAVALARGCTSWWYQLINRRQLPTQQETTAHSTGYNCPLSKRELPTQQETTTHSTGDNYPLNMRQLP